MIGKILLLLCSIIVSLIVAELVSREVMYGALAFQKNNIDEAMFFKPDPLTGWSHIQDFQSRFANPSEGYDALVTIDRLGLRSNSNNFADQLDGSPEIVILGDSNTAGFEVDDQETFAARLEQMLFESGCKYKVHNAGVRGYGTDQSYWHLLQLKRSIDPEFTIYMFTFNDLMDNRTIKRLRKIYGKPAYAYERDHLELIKPKSSQLDRAYYAYIENRPDGYQLIEGSSQGHLIDIGFFVKENLALSNLVLPLYYEYFDPRVDLESNDTDQIQMDLQVLKELLLMMKAKSKNFLLMEFPTAQTDFRLSSAIDLDQLGIDYIDLYPYFSPPVDQYRWETDVHWNKLGHQTAARALFSELHETLCGRSERS